MSLYPLLKELHQFLALLMLGAGITTLVTSLYARWRPQPQRLHRLFHRLNWLNWTVIASCAVLIPLTGWLLIKLGSWPINHLWLLASAGLYALAGLAWLPLLWLQPQIKKLALQAAPDAQRRAQRWINQSIVLSSFAIALLLSVSWLMTSKPL